MLAVPENLDAVNENIFDTQGILLGLLIGGEIRDAFGIKDHHIGKHASLQKTAVVQSKIGSRKPRQSPNGVR
jgi:hypothetical protein